MTVLALFLLGLCFGSFTNALVWRLHELETSKKLTKKQRQELSILHGRSMCPHCRHGLAWYDLLPIASWLSLEGKCRYCHHPISWQYPLVELLGALLFAGSYLAWPYGFDAAGIVAFGFWLVFLIGFLALAVYDLRWMLLPNKVVYVLLGLAVVLTLFKLFTWGDPGAVLVEALAGFLSIGGLFYVLYQVSGGKWIGGGDVKLGFMIGILVGGPLNSLLVIFIASSLGTLVSLPLMARKSLKATSRIPYGPFLLAATVVTYLYGARVADWYTQAFL